MAPKVREIQTPVCQPQGKRETLVRVMELKKGLIGNFTKTIKDLAAAEREALPLARLKAQANKPRNQALKQVARMQRAQVLQQQQEIRKCQL